jgi:uncharacterized membrane protein YcaP (DUF421 family)
VFTIVTDLLSRLSGYHPGFLRFSPSLIKTALMAGLLLLFQLLLAFGLGYLFSELFYENIIIEIIIGFAFSFFWYRCLRIFVRKSQNYRATRDLASLSLLIFFFAVFFTTAIIIYSLFKISEFQSLPNLTVFEKISTASYNAVVLNSDFLTVIFMIIFYLAIFIFLLFPYFMIYSNHAHPYYNLINTYKLLKST